MVSRTPHTPAELFAADETGWLELTAALVRAQQYEQIDSVKLAEFLTDMSRRDRREVMSRLVVLLAHLLKWEYQPDQRCGSWLSTILTQQRELRQLLESRTLYLHAESIFADAYQDARKQAAAETGLARNHFPAHCPWNMSTLFDDPGELGSNGSEQT